MAQYDQRLCYSLGHIAQSVTCLTADTGLTADPGVASSISAQSYTLVEIDHEIICTVFLLPYTDSRRVVVSYKRKYEVNHFVKLAQEKSVVRGTDCPNMNIAVDWDIKIQTKPNLGYLLFEKPRPHHLFAEAFHSSVMPHADPSAIISKSKAKI